MSEIIKTNTEYSKWIKEVSLRFRNSQIKAATKVNREMLLFYWSIGHDISENYNEVKYGKSFFKNLSLDLQDALPDVKSFSVTNFISCISGNFSCIVSILLSTSSTVTYIELSLTTFFSKFSGVSTAIILPLFIIITLLQI